MQPAEFAHHLSRQTRDVLTRIARAAHPPMHGMSAASARAFYEKAAGVLEVDNLPMARDERLTLPTRDGQAITARLWAPSAGVLPVLLYFHGGGFTIGSSRTHEPLCRRLAALAQCAVVSVDYRLAPEHRFPTAVFDAWDALSWLRSNGQQLGLDVAAIAVGGDSAGGTLAAVSALHARDQGWPLAGQLLFYPGTTAHQDTGSHARYAKGLVLGEATIDYFFEQYIPTRSQRSDWRFAPLLADDHSAVAPAWLGLAEVDPLVDEGVAYADALRMAGVPVDLEIYPGVVHGFIQWGRVEPAALLAHEHAAKALRGWWGLA
jgi:acetyl esterase